MLPKWIGKVLPRGEMVHEWYPPVETQPTRRWTTDNRLKWEAKIVCEACNLGWMHALEERARPFLTSMIRGRGRTLYDEGRAAVAFWGQKTALVVAAADPDFGEIDPSDYHALYERQAALDGTTVLIAASNVLGGFTRTRGLTLSVLEGTDPGYGVTLHIGHLVLEVIRIKGEQGKALKVRGKLEAAVRLRTPR